MIPNLIHFLEFLASFVLVVVYLHTRNVYLIAFVFAVMIIGLGVDVGGNPLITLPKMLLGQIETKHFLKTIVAQLLGMSAAVMVYLLLPRLNVNVRNVGKIRDD